MLITHIKNNLDELINLLRQLPDGEYSMKWSYLSNATIGEHTRHVIEMFQCLSEFYESGLVNYDKRARNIRMETDAGFAIASIEEIKNSLDREDKDLELLQRIDGHEIMINSTYTRELLYNLEHCIHHQALIKVAVLQSGKIAVDANFGVARSTIEYRNQCVQ
ncbi:MAG TPA: DinB family protein [Flavobacterium sp.]|nr:DinB family protein [Flavobacterium sp.]